MSYSRNSTKLFRAMGICLYISRSLDKSKSQYCSNFPFRKFSRNHSGGFSNWSHKLHFWLLEIAVMIENLCSQYLQQLLQYIRQNHLIGVSGNQRECALKAAAEELSSNEDFVLIRKWNARDPIIEHHVSTSLLFGITREHFSSLQHALLYFSWYWSKSSFVLRCSPREC